MKQVRGTCLPWLAKGEGKSFKVNRLIEMNQTAGDNSDAGPVTDSVIAVVQYCTKAIKEVGFIFDCLICKVFA